MDRKLINYLPPVLREVLEFQAINEANEPEISAAWDALDRLMANQFLDTADDAGVSIWEQELGIHPKDTDTLEVRKIRIKSMWNMNRPYTITWLRQWLAAVAEGLPYEAKVRDGYTLDITTQWDKDGQVESIKNLLEQGIIPANLRIHSQNAIHCHANSRHNVATGLVLCDCLCISDSGNQTISLEMSAVPAAGLVMADHIEITDEERKVSKNGTV